MLTEDSGRDLETSMADDLKDAMSGRDDNDWAANWYPWGDEYTVKNLKSVE